MLFGLWTKIVANSYVVGAGLLAVVAFIARFQFLKNARDRAELEADTLKATVHANKVKRKIVKEETKKLSVKRAELKKRIKEKRREDFEGLDNLSDSNKP